MKLLSKINIARLLSLLILMGYSPAILSQQRTIDSATLKFENYQADNLPEKLFVHSDKDFYLAGELVWFKLYCVDGYYHKPLDISKVAYIEILSPAKQAIAQAKIELRDGSGSGSFQLPSFLNSGNYLLRAYTSRMKNYPATFYFEKIITIVNTARTIGVPTVLDTASYDLQLLPEGGNLVNNVESKIAFKVVDRNGKGRDGRGVVIDGSNDTVVRFQSMKYGMGNFNFRPVSGKEYRVLYFVGDKIRASSRFPVVYEKGYVMKLTRLSDQSLKMTISATGSNMGNLSLMIHTRGILKITQKIQLAKNDAVVEIDEGKLGEGISVLTLLDDTGKPVCERLYFKRPIKKDVLSVSVDKTSYGMRKKVSAGISLNVSASDKQPDLSMAVFLLDSLQENNLCDIASYLWLRSDLIGSIEDPGYYFKEDPAVNEALDNLMLTQGWRRFEWNDVLNGKQSSPGFETEYAGPVVKGKFIKNGQPVSGMETWLSVPGNHFYLASDSSDTNGNTRFYLPAFYGSNEIIIQSSSKDDNARFFSLSNPFSENYSSTKVPLLEVDERWKEALNKRNISAQVQHVFSDSIYQEFVLPDNMDTVPFYGKPDKQYLLDDYTRFVTMEEVLREYVTEVRLRKQGDQYKLYVKNTPYQNFFENEPLVLVDGVPVTDLNKVLSLDPLKIRKLDIVARKFYIGTRIKEGIVSYSSYEGDLGGIAPGENSIVIDYEGLQLQRKFYSPQYENIDQATSRVPDFRNVLLWSPFVKTTVTGNGNIEFYTSDLPGTYAIVVQGITSDGTPVSSTQIIKVNPR